MLHVDFFNKSTKYKNSPYFKGSVLWDTLPADVISIPTLGEFKARIRRIFSPFNELLF